MSPQGYVPPVVPGVPEPHPSRPSRGPRPPKQRPYAGPLFSGVVNETPELNCNCLAEPSEECVRAPPRFPWGPFLGATWNTTNTVLGAGTLAMPYVVKCLGPAGFLAISLLLLCMTLASVHLLLKACDMAQHEIDRMSPKAQRLCFTRCRRSTWKVHADTPEHRTLQFPNYESLALFYYGQYGAYAVVFVFIAGGVALTMAYMLLISETLAPAILGHRLPEDQQPLMLVAVALFGAMPLASIRDVALLRGPSFMGVMSLVFVALYTVVRCVMAGPPLAEDLEMVERVNSGWVVLPACAMLTSAFSCHISTLPIYSGLGPGRGVMQVVVPTALTAAFILYIGIGLGGYFLFGERIRQNILDSLWERSPAGSDLWLLYALNGCVSIALLSSLPLVIWPLRSCLCMVQHRFRAWLQWTKLPADEVPPPGPALWFGMTSGIVGIVTYVAVHVPQVAVALSIVGAVGGAGIVFIFPSLFYLAGADPKRQLPASARCRRRWFWQWVARCLIVFGAVSGTLSLGVTLNRILSASSR